MVKQEMNEKMPDTIRLPEHKHKLYQEIDSWRRPEQTWWGALEEKLSETKLIKCTKGKC